VTPIYDALGRINLRSRPRIQQRSISLVTDLEGGAALGFDSSRDLEPPNTVETQNYTVFRVVTIDQSTRSSEPS